MAYWFLIASSLIAANVSTQAPAPIFRSGETVLFQGDSITDGNRGRNADPNHILGHGYVFVIASQYGAAFPNDQLVFVNRGISGNTLADLSNRWDGDAIQLKPSVLSILVGINDINYAFGRGSTPDLKDFEARYDQLLERTAKAIPGVRLVLCEPFALDTGRVHEEYPARRKAVDAADAIIVRLAAKFHAAAVDFQSVFDHAAKVAPADHWIWDGIHPTYSGHQLMAEEWVRAYREFYANPLEDPARNSAIVPEVNFERDSYDWLHRHADVLDQQAKTQPEVVMIGDSITHFWGGTPAAKTVNGPAAWSATFGTTSVLNMGFGWDRTQNVLWRLHHGEFSGVHPKTVVLNIGTNNLVGDKTARTNSPDEVAVGIQAVVSELQKRSPDSKIVVMGVFPRGFAKDNSLDLSIRRLNGILAEMLSHRPNVQFLDIGDKLRDSNGLVTPEIFRDGTHPTEKGYAIWGQALKQAGAIP